MRDPALSVGSHISLFAGVGMTDIAIEKAGFKTIATAEIDPWARGILRLRYPDAMHFEDVKDVRMTASARHRLGATPTARMLSGRGPLMVSGGFPCQDVSSAGTGAGIAGARSGLWSEFARVIFEFQPDYVLIENSAMLRARGLNVILHDLVDLGYDARWDCIPAAAVGAPHLRDRMFVVAVKCYPEWSEPDDADDCIATYRKDGGVGDPATGEAITVLPRAGSMTNGYIFEEEPMAPIRLAKTANLAWFPGRSAARLFPTPTKSDGSGGPGTSPKRTGGNNLRTQIAIESGNGRLNPAWVEWMMGLPLGWTSPFVTNSALGPIAPWDSEPVPRTASLNLKDRNKRLRALGNGLVWQCVSRALTMIPNNEEE